MTDIDNPLVGGDSSYDLVTVEPVAFALIRNDGVIERVERGRPQLDNLAAAHNDAELRTAPYRVEPLYLAAPTLGVRPEPETAVPESGDPQSCTRCNGEGAVPETHQTPDGELFMDCPVCRGTGERVPDAEIERLRGLAAEVPALEHEIAERLRAASVSASSESGASHPSSEPTTSGEPATGKESLQVAPANSEPVYDFHRKPIDSVRLEDGPAVCAAARAEIKRLCEGGKWTMCVPVQIDDSDIVFARLLRFAELRARSSQPTLVETPDEETAAKALAAIVAALAGIEARLVQLARSEQSLARLTFADLAAEVAYIQRMATGGSAK